MESQTDPIKKKKFPKVVLIILVVGIICVTGYFGFSYYKSYLFNQRLESLSKDYTLVRSTVPFKDALTSFSSAPNYELKEITNYNEFLSELAKVPRILNVKPPIAYDPDARALFFLTLKQNEFTYLIVYYVD